MMKKPILFIFAVLLTSCQSDHFYKREIRKLEGWPETKMVRRFGSPEDILLHSVGDLSRGWFPQRPPTPQVLSLYPATHPENLAVQIKSLSWQRGRILLTAWFHEKEGQWIALYVEEWNMDVIE